MDPWNFLLHNNTMRSMEFDALAQGGRQSNSYSAISAQCGEWKRVKAAIKYWMQITRKQDQECEEKWTKLSLF